MVLLTGGSDGLQLGLGEGESHGAKAIRSADISHSGPSGARFTQLPMGPTEGMAGLHPQPKAFAEPKETTEAQIGAVPAGCLAVLGNR
jgi:hypothetical protein